MKVLKFRELLSKQVLSGQKTKTYRLFDDKNLSSGDIVSFVVWETHLEFAKAKLLDVKEIKLGELTDKDWDGHEKFLSDEEMYSTYSKYYHRVVDKDSLVKVINFKLE
jgi:hypothetical protein